MTNTGTVKFRAREWYVRVRSLAPHPTRVIDGAASGLVVEFGPMLLPQLRPSIACTDRHRVG